MTDRPGPDILTIILWGLGFAAAIPAIIAESTKMTLAFAVMSLGFILIGIVNEELR